MESIFPTLSFSVRSADDGVVVVERRRSRHPSIPTSTTHTWPGKLSE